jgi:hypothetical protein
LRLKLGPEGGALSSHELGGAAALALRLVEDVPEVDRERSHPPQVLGGGNRRAPVHDSTGGEESHPESCDQQRKTDLATDSCITPPAHLPPPQFRKEPREKRAAPGVTAPSAQIPRG